MVRFYLQAILKGGVRGVGLQKYGAGINFVGYICVATPCLLVLIFVAKLGVVGKLILRQDIY